MKHKLAISVFLLVSACSKGNFAGDGAVTQAGTAKGSQEIDSSTVDGAGSGKKPSNGTVDGAASGKKPSNGSVIGSGGGGPNGSSTTPDGISTDDKGIEFGGNGIFRVGDGRAEDSSCKSTLDTFELEGAQFSFEFNVLEDDTVVDISVNRICAIDYDDSNFISLVKKGSILGLERELLPVEVVSVGDSALKPFSSTFTLQKGSYAVQIVSERNLGHRLDRDDFIIGNIRVNANKPVVGTAIQTD